MKNKIEWYKEISMKMMKSLKKNDYDKFNLLIDERQGLIDILIKNNEINFFKDLYNKNDVKSIDVEIRNILEKKIEKTKIEIREHKIQAQGNTSYNNMKKEKINIFSKKV